ncbi:acetate kinase [Streptantibioticus cattleyicolor NRRL 8057 = DSM 46488]|uniref:Acetate kinase n=1 Tax=Streptantibioticus cattleyicolor (strain ATCC 35852 / DSM 46488 / JCM 4925 / NBRC 14057 / NRRL 8057) TaxID=1003195 RepID=G8X369_STREN|nr:acetate kinase [Streptantibioticus cattleyicolor]AEW96604.1 acetate kinase [Streptantibioticus cattleyicolor NRRL 8057 = DSM 46488]MYS61099.1 acetate/propionate family kinase [Streptomyces sp. SID5468]
MSTASRVLVLNSGSSSVKYQLLEMAGPSPTTTLDGGAARRIDTDGSRTASGIVERIGESDGVADHAAALRQVAEELAARGLGLDSPQLAAVGHRVVHGGTRFTEPTLITDEVVAEIEKLVPLAPLHNPANITGIKVARALRPDLPQVAVFDTAFHSTMPEAAARYAVDVATADRYGIRRYGFHGTSHAYVSRAAAALVGKEPAEANVIVLHLGNGASASAVRGGVCVDTSMGLTPLEGLVMGTRSGDLDPAVVFHLARVAGMATEDIDGLLNKRSGLLGLCGDNDMREIGRRMAEGDEAAQLAFDVYVHRLRKYVGAYCAVLGRVDVIAFTAGVGENSAAVREAALRGLEPLGIEIDAVRNAVRGSAARLVSPPAGRVAVAVVPTDEEMEIARQAYSLVRTSSHSVREG